MSAYRTPGEATTPIIIRTPAPDTEERLVLVPLDAVSRTEGGDDLLAIRTANARDATPADLERGGYVTGEMLAEHVRIVWAAGQKAEPVGVAMLRKLKERAEKAEAFVGDVSRADPRMRGRLVSVMLDECEDLEALEQAHDAHMKSREGLSLATQIAKLTARAELGNARSSPTRSAYAEAVRERDDAKELARVLEVERDTLRTDLDAERRRADAIERANVELHEKLAQAERELDGACSPDCQARIDYVEADNAKLRAELARLTAPGEGSAVMSSGLTEAVELELMRIVDGAIGPLPEIGVTLVCRGHASGAAHTVSTAAYRLGVAHERAKDRAERCLVAQAVGMGADLCVTAHGVAYRVTVAKGRHMQRAYPDAADVPETLARLLGEVSK